MLSVPNRGIKYIPVEENLSPFIRTSSVSKLPLSSSFRCSSAVEQLTVNQLVAGSNPATGASNRKALLRECFSVVDAPCEKSV